uniref:Proteasome subunit alpha type n=2 Tax=Bacillariophyta TaxID=2836 RepID=A0A7R9W4P6_9STRA|mmetsp:Transcript_33521/g.61903  ORF Transcript_33521/g.61903 Transcript_33521/m.61903 type:complete len:280 (+) Transcript_33521:102-941(+)|eukprot:CAMPEP_0197436926 /NCGR_PEP_ID=MMETSP1175-20131217/4263_1 /TAXON_ID=1003142 /ORGANISM="Triceratium dubium, Strain CCMP147" /LENGTH=279 /DNA_ID=CAMNT_0042966319 /DNA_START=102 /DNA_END=941 /DNA_ORIENTATION=-
MFRNQYDTDVTVWSPEGRLLQVEYAMESVKQGSACIGLRSSTHAVLGALKRSVSELSSHQKKLLEIDTHIGVGIAGLTADARTLAKWMRNECLNHRYVYGTPMPVGRMMTDLADKHQRTTQTYVRRPYGVGLLVAAYDKSGPHLYQTCPSGNMYEYHASAIGARSQSGRTYLEKIFDNDQLKDASKDDLIMHALRAIAGCVGGDGELTKENGSVGIVGKDEAFYLIEGDELQPYLDRLELEGGTGGGDDDDDDDDDEEEGEGGEAVEESKEEGGDAMET